MVIGKRDDFVEIVSFEIPREQADRLRRLEGRDPSDIARNHLIGFYEDKRRTSIELIATSLGWLPEVYQAMVKHVGRGAVSHFIREATYSYATHRKVKLSPVPLLKEGHVEGAVGRRKSGLPTAQPGRQSIVVTIKIPAQWDEALRHEWGSKASQRMKAAAQLRVEKETGKLLPVQRGMGPFLGREG